MNAAAVAAILSALALAGCSDAADDVLQGYVEGTYVQVAPETGGRIVERAAAAGGRVAAGDLLFRLDDADAQAAVAAAEARLAQAKAQLVNLRSGRRPEEVAVVEAELSEARAALVAAEDDFDRQAALRANGVVPQAAVDAAKGRRDAARARVSAMERQVEVANLPAREAEIDAAARNVAALKSALDQARIALARRTVMAPAGGLVEETFFEMGELVAAGQPVVSLLPAANRKVLFFVPETRLASVRAGDRIAIACDGCADGLAAEIATIASEAEFTPPLIYSRDNRGKLVFRVEARPLGEAATLKPGQPVDVRLAGSGAGS